MSETCERDEQQRTLLAALARHEADDARLFAHRMRLRADLDRLWNTPDRSGPEQFGVIELAGTARIGQGRASTQLSDARRLVELFTGTLALLEAGTMFRETGVLLLELTRNCTEEVQVELEQRLLAQIGTANGTDVRRIVTAAIPEVEADLDPNLTQERLDRARRHRRVWTSTDQDGMCQVGALLDVIRGRRWSLDFEELVRAQKIADDKTGVERTQDQRRADLFAELPGRLRTLIQAIQQGKTTELLALAQQDPDAAEDLEALAATLPTVTDEVTTDDTVANEGTAETDDTRGSEAVEMVSGAQWLAQDEQPLAVPEQALVGDDRAPTEPDPPAQVEPVLDRLTRLSVEELTVELLRLSVRDPQVLNVHIPMSTLLDLDHRAGYVEGHGPVPAEQVRLLVPTAGLRRLFVDASSGVPIGIDPVVQPPLIDQTRQANANPPADRPTDTSDDQASGGDATVLAERARLAGRARRRLLGMLGPTTVAHRAEPRHDPSARLTRQVEIRDQRCIGIGCSCAAERAHKDHELRYPDGPTAEWNVSCKSARCHRAKHAGWTVIRHHNGHISWISPLGHTYTRPGVWQPPPPLPQDVTLPAPRLPHQDGHDPWPQDSPLWTEPQKTQPKPAPRKPQPTGGWDDEPPF